MKYLASLFLIIAVACGSETTDTAAASAVNTQPKPTTIYFVRHAETDGPSANNPNLSQEGKQRAERLAELVGKVDAVYATGYHRTQQTAEPTARKSGVEVQTYQAGDDKFLAGKMGNILVVGHSNTIPDLVNSISGSSAYTNIDESNYGNLFTVKNGRVKRRDY